MKSKSFKFMCVNLGLLALSYTVANAINILAVLNFQQPEEVESREIGFRG